MQSSKFKLIVKSLPSGIQAAKEILYETVDKNTALFLSGGKTPKDLYKQLAEEKRLLAGVVGLVDERFGKKLHDNSNEKMIQETGLIAYLKKRRIPFYPILRLHPKGGNERLGTAKLYNQKLEKLFSKFKKRIAILGIGVDGHIAGLPTSSKFKVQSSKLLIMEYNDKDGFYKERITMTFKALSEMDLLLVLVFGEEKRKALQLMFTKGSIEEIPVRFLRQKGIAEKTILITDQRI